jgi:hypothetical protein
VLLELIKQVLSTLSIVDIAGVSKCGPGIAGLPDLIRDSTLASLDSQASCGDVFGNVEDVVLCGIGGGMAYARGGEGKARVCDGAGSKYRFFQGFYRGLVLLS